TAKASAEKVAGAGKNSAQADKSIEAVMSAISGGKRKKSKSKDKIQDSDKDLPHVKKSKKAKEEERKKRRAFAG
ncbi:hypothetical protein EV174_006558, partial [Coemansia sp. RSA 2320]